ncbi:MAG: P-II family nitrogen regulator [Alphaproteobacteria bacterium]
MKFKLIMALVAEDRTDDVLQAAREAGATGATVVTRVRGEGIEPEKTFLGLELAGQRDLLMFLVAEQLSRDILETICSIGQFDDKPGSGIAFQLGIEDAVGLSSQLRAISEEIVDQL